MKYGIPVPELRRRIGSREFNRCKAYMLEEPNMFNPQHYYLANIAAEIHRGNSKHPKLVKLKDWIIKFVFKTKESVEKPVVDGATTPVMDKEATKRLAKMQKMTWAARLGLTRPPKEDDDS